MPGSHTFEYSIIPHAGDWEKAFHQAYWFARPLSAIWTGRHSGCLENELSFLSISPSSLLVSAVKTADDGSNDLVVRVYNVLGVRAEGVIRAFFPVRSAAIANLAEQPQEPLEMDQAGDIRLSVGPHKIVTLRLTPQPNEY